MPEYRRQQWYVIGPALRQLRRAKGIGQEELAHKVGKRGKTVWRIENVPGYRVREIDCRAIAKALGASFEELTGKWPGGESLIHDAPPGAEPLPGRWVKIPLLGVCPASPKRVVNDEVLEWVPAPQELQRRYGRVYLLKVKGDSMNRAGIEDGDTVLVAADWQPESGRVVVAVVDGECTVKRFSRMGHILTLSPDSTNPKHLPQSYTRANEVLLRGVVVEVWRKRVT